MDEGLNFLRILGAIIPLLDVGDQMRWKLKSNGDSFSFILISNLKVY